jgi:hypothetical protein
MLLSIQSAVLVALAQIGVIVIGVLASGYYDSAITGDLGYQMPLVTILIYRYGIFCFAIPLVWISTAMQLKRQETVSEDAKSLMLIFGIVLLISLLIFFGYGLLSPFMHADFTIGDPDN